MYADNTEQCSSRERWIDDRHLYYYLPKITSSLMDVVARSTLVMRFAIVPKISFINTKLSDWFQYTSYRWDKTDIFIYFQIPAVSWHYTP